jgi:hypothetical protein
MSRLKLLLTSTFPVYVLLVSELEFRRTYLYDKLFLILHIIYFHLSLSVFMSFETCSYVAVSRVFVSVAVRPLEWKCGRRRPQLQSDDV